MEYYFYNGYKNMLPRRICLSLSPPPLSLSLSKHLNRYYKPSKGICPLFVFLPLPSKLELFLNIWFVFFSMSLADGNTIL
jgi:hypothetical protein